MSDDRHFIDVINAGYLPGWDLLSSEKTHTQAKNLQRLEKYHKIKFLTRIVWLIFFKIFCQVPICCIQQWGWDLYHTICPHVAAYWNASLLQWVGPGSVCWIDTNQNFRKDSSWISGAWVSPWNCLGTRIQQYAKNLKTHSCNVISYYCKHCFSVTSQILINLSQKSSF